MTLNLSRIEQTKLDIINATDSLIKEKNFNDVTYNDIAMRANVSRRTVYRHFPTKDLIVMELLVKNYIPFNSNILSKTKDCDMVGFACLEFFFEVWYQEMKNSQDLYIYLGILTEHIQTKSAKSEVFSRFTKSNMLISKELTNIVQKGVNDGSIRCVDKPATVCGGVVNAIGSSAIDIHRNIRRYTICDDFNIWNMFKVLMKQVLISFKVSE